MTEDSKEFSPDVELVDLGDGAVKAVQLGVTLDGLDEDPEYLTAANATQEDFDQAWAEAAQVNPDLDATPTDFGLLAASDEV